MVRYIALKYATRAEAGGYDILACECDGDVIEALEVRQNVVAEHDRAKYVINRLNSDDVDPVHMEDIIEDTLYEMAL